MFDKERKDYVNINSLAEFISFIEEKSVDGYYYRGENRKYPEISSSLLRNKNIAPKYENLVNDFFAEVVNKVDDQIKKNFIPFCQHHGLYTNLIDLTESPYVALYFACVGYVKYGCGYLHFFDKSNCIDMTTMMKEQLNAPASCYNVIQYRERDRYVKDSIWSIFINMYIDKLNSKNKEQIINDMLIRLNKYSINVEESKINDIGYIFELYFDTMIRNVDMPFPKMPYVIMKPDNVFDRIRNQNGLFIYQLFTSHPHLVEVNKVNTYIQQILPTDTIVINNQQEILDELDYMGVNSKYIFTDYENVAKYINGCYSR